MTINEDIREMIYQRTTAGAIKKKALEFGMQTLRMDGARKVQSGVTTIAEVLRVTQADNI
jgi:type II secretory ATPase GspE/PulE/Tfp pilus assembly ATPase PilB-like protein